MRSIFAVRSDSSSPYVPVFMPVADRGEDRGNAESCTRQFVLLVHGFTDFSSPMPISDQNLSSFVDVVTSVYESIAILIEAKQPFVETHFGLTPDMLVAFRCFHGFFGSHCLSCLIILKHRQVRALWWC